MKRQLSICLLAAAALAAPRAHSGGAEAAATAESADTAGTVIVRCVDGAGRVTLTDRPCEAGAATVRMAGMPSGQAPHVAPYPLLARQDALPPPRALQRRSAPTPRVKAEPLASDVATLKAAHAQFLLDEVGASKEALAGLE